MLHHGDACRFARVSNGGTDIRDHRSRHDCRAACKSWQPRHKRRDRELLPSKRTELFPGPGLVRRIGFSGCAELSFAGYLARTGNDLAIRFDQCKVPGKAEFSTAGETN